MSREGPGVFELGRPRTEMARHESALAERDLYAFVASLLSLT